MVIDALAAGATAVASFLAPKLFDASLGAVFGAAWSEIDQAFDERDARRAFEAALTTALQEFAQKYPALAASFFDETFLRGPALAELEAFLTLDQDPSPARLATAYASQFSRRSANVEPACADFIRIVGERLQALPELRDHVTARLIRLMARILSERQQAQAQPLVPSTIPPPVADFVGREAEIGKVMSTLTGGGRVAIAAVRGMGGVGKTQLAREVAGALADGFPDGRVLVEMRGTAAQPLTAHAAAVVVIRAFAPEARLPDAPEAVLGLYRSLLAGKRALVLLDNATDLEQVRPLVPAPPAAVLVTSRREIRLDGAPPLLLGALPEEKALELLRSELGAQVAEADLRAIATACRCLPIALRAAGRTLAESPSRSVAGYLQALGDARWRLGHLKPEDDPELDVRAVLALSLDRLAEAEPALLPLFLRLAVFPASFDAPAAVAVWATDPEAAGRALDKLARWSLLELEDGHYRLHDLVRDLASERLDDAAREEAQARHAGHYCEVLDYAQQLYLRGGEHVLAGLALFDAERANIEAGQAWAAARIEASDDAARLAYGYTNAGLHILRLRLYLREVVAWLEVAAAACRQIGDRRGESNALGNLSVTLAELGEPRKAIDYLEQRLTLSRGIGDRHGEGRDILNIGTAWLRLGLLKKAAKCFRQALIIIREIGDRHGEALVFLNMGHVHMQEYDAERAIICYERALTASSEIGDRYVEVSAAGSLGNAWHALGSIRSLPDYYERAQGYYERWYAISQEMKDRKSEGMALIGLGIAWRSLGDTRKALAYHEQALDITREIGDRRGEGNAHWNLALTCREAGEVRRAIAEAVISLRIMRAIKDPSATEIAAFLRAHGVDPDAAG